LGGFFIACALNVGCITLHYGSNANPTQPHNLTLIEELVDLRKRERCFPVTDTLTLRVQRPLRARIATLAIQFGSTDSEITRYLLHKALDDMGIDALAPLGMGAKQ
jgi:hypothetical protein